ncbi:MAG: PEP-CTERM sorting domain-containing protein [Verrucomicrobiaceae bacterium]|nr:PEP-CTERM sorting domain-containing protein [Verrucomicrobiaceae bacterium]
MSKRPLLLAVFLLGSFAPVQAVTLFSTLGRSSFDAVEMNGINVRLANDFQTGAQGATITGFSVALGNLDDIAHTFAAHIFADNAGVPGGTLVGSFDTSVSVNAGTGGTGNIFTFTDAGIALAAGTTYWVALEMLQGINSPGDNAFWWLSDDELTPVDAVGSFLNVPATGAQKSTDSGASYSDYSALVSNFRFSLEGTLAPVPEPSRALLAALGLLALITRRRR